MFSTWYGRWRKTSEKVMFIKIRMKGGGGGEGEEKDREKKPKYVRLSILLSGFEDVLSCHKLRSSIQPMTSGNTLLRLAKLR